MPEPDAPARWHLEDPDPALDTPPEGHHAQPDEDPRYEEVVMLLFLCAQARGDLADVTVDFTATVDSAGEPWPVTNDIVVGTS